MKPGLTIKNINALECLETTPLLETVDLHFQRHQRLLKGDDEISKRLYRRTRRHSIHLDEVLTSIPQHKTVRNTKINSFVKQQNIVLNRISLFRAQKY